MIEKLGVVSHVLVICLLALLIFSVIILIIFLVDAIVQDFTGYSFFNKICTKVENLYYIRRSKKISKAVKRKIKVHNKKSKNLNYDPLKFEYNYVMDLVDKAVSNVVQNDQVQVNDLYIFKFDEYFRQIKCIREVKQNSIEAIACLVKAIIKEPITNESDLNVLIIVELLKEISNYKYLRSIRYNNEEEYLYYLSKDDIFKLAIADYLKYNCDIFIISAFIIKELNF